MHHLRLPARRSLRTRISYKSATTTAALLAAGLSIGLLPSGEANAQVIFETRALTGDTAPGTSAGVTFDSFNAPTINAAGQVAFTASLTGTGVNNSNNVGIWSEAAEIPGNYALVARSGDAAPGTEPGVVYEFIVSPVLNAAGEIAISASLTGTGVDSTNDQGIWSKTTGSFGSPGLVVRTGDTAPGTESGVVFSSLFNLVSQPNIFSPVFNAAGQIAFKGNLSGPGVDTHNNTGIWSEAAGTPGNLGLVARAGDAAPGTEPGVNFSNFETPVLNVSGQVAFRGTLTGTGVDGTNNRGVWSEAAGAIGSPALIAREGDAAPGTEPGVNYIAFDLPVINAAGQVAFRGAVTGNGVDGTNDRGIWSEAAGAIGSPALVAREGDAAPGTEPGVAFSLLRSPVLSGAGHTAFRGSITGNGVDNSNNEGIWSESAGTFGTPGLAVRSGDAAPGTEPGVVFNGFSNPLINAAGQVAFQGYLTGNGVDNENDVGIWVTDPDGVLSLIAREGDDFNLYGDLRTIASTNLSFLDHHVTTGSEDGRGSSFNDAGQLAFWASFTDGSSGIFVANTVASALRGDYNADGFVSQADLDLVLLNWGADQLPEGFDQSALDGGLFDGLISQNELDGVLLNWGDGSSPDLSAIPEPATAGILSLLALAGLSRRARRLQ